RRAGRPRDGLPANASPGPSPARASPGPRSPFPRAAGQAASFSHSYRVPRRNEEESAMRKLFVALAAAVLAAPAARADSEFSVVLQGGASKYNQSLSNASDTGALYGARLGILPTPMLGFELGYVGAQNNIKQDLTIGRSGS